MSRRRAQGRRRLRAPAAGGASVERRSAARAAAVCKRSRWSRPRSSCRMHSTAGEGGRGGAGKRVKGGVHIGARPPPPAAAEAAPRLMGAWLPSTPPHTPCSCPALPSTQRALLMAATSSWQKSLMDCRVASLSWRSHTCGSGGRPRTQVASAWAWARGGRRTEAPTPRWDASAASSCPAAASHACAPRPAPGGGASARSRASRTAQRSLTLRISKFLPLISSALPSSTGKPSAARHAGGRKREAERGVGDHGPAGCAAGAAAGRHEGARRIPGQRRRARARLPAARLRSAPRRGPSAGAGACAPRSRGNRPAPRPTHSCLRVISSSKATRTSAVLSPSAVALVQRAAVSAGGLRMRHRVPRTPAGLGRRLRVASAVQRPPILPASRTLVLTD